VSYGLLWVQALGIPVVTTIHHPLTVDLRSALVRARTFRETKGALTFYPVRSQARVARRLAGIVTSSEASRRQIESDFGVRPDRIHNVHNGVDLPAPGKRRSRPGQPELLFVGRCSDPNKGLEHLLGALAQLPEPFVLRVLDRFPADSSLERQVNELRIGHRIRWEGKLPRADLEAAFRDATIVVLPSLFEGFGLPAVEALAAGTPVVCTTAGALTEVILTAGVGTLVPPADPAALAAAIVGVWGRWEEEQAACVAARERIEQAFGWPEVAARTAQVYEHVRAIRSKRPEEPRP
jgi:glycosyltransferase involved in cell wall biosynthesis